VGNSAERRPCAGLPSAEVIVAERSFAPNRPMGSAAAGAGHPPTYRILRTVEVDAYDPPISVNDVRAFGEAQADIDQNFRGTSRRTAKLSLSKATVEMFDDVEALINTLPAHLSMIRHQPPITTDADCDRVPSEDRNIRIKAFLYAASREDDNDYHLIVGRAPTFDPIYMTMELSGLPPAANVHFDRLNDARQSYGNFFGDNLPDTSYDFYEPPIPIEVEGSLFFDMSHATGPRPGPQSLRGDMPVVWEIHPISKITFEP
jgi:hypothetical protein